MKCMNCGTAIPEGRIRCPRCGQEIQIVPDYNPLDEMLTAQVKGAVSETLRIDLENRKKGQYASSTKRSGREERSPGRPVEAKARRPEQEGPVVPGNMRKEQGRNGQGKNVQRMGRPGQMNDKTDRTGRISPEERERRRRQAEKKRMKAKRRRRRLLLLMGAFVAICVAVGFAFYQNSYAGLMKKGNKALVSGEYAEAIEYFEKAISKGPGKSDAYIGLSKVYIVQDDLGKAEEVFLNAITAQSTSVEIYRAAVQFYMDTDQVEKITVLLEECSDKSVLSALSDYVSQAPKFSLDEKTEYDDIQALELSGSGKEIYYTTDGTDPTTSSALYAEPIRLEEGETEVRAISVNAKGIPSPIVKKTYTVAFPIEDAPSVTPSTGQYEGGQTIQVTVPENYEAYYTMDGTEPGPNAPTGYKYTGPIEMPKGNTIFSVVLADQKGRLSDVTKRNYERIDSE